MKLPRRKFLHLAAGAAALPAMPQFAQAQTYPTRPITMIVPASAGGPTDGIARIIAAHMSVSLDQTVLIENTSGAGGSIGVGRVARAEPDGYTIGIGHWTHYVLNGAIYSLQYDLLKDFAPVAMVATGPLVMVARKSLPASDLNELIVWLKANPDKASAGTGGVGTPPHVAGLFFQRATGTRFQFVPYRGTGPAMLDLVAGRIDLMLDQASNVLPQARAGTIKAFAVTAKARLASAPDIPTVDEAGLPGFYISVWHGTWVPKATPRDAIIKLNAAVVDALANPTVRNKLADLGQELPPPDQQTPEALGALQEAEIEKWWPIVKEAGIKPE
jgi:tripartite-type tricarboxylate transporter receptor subunit TctC